MKTLGRGNHHSRRLELPRLASATPRILTVFVSTRATFIRMRGPCVDLFWIRALITVHAHETPSQITEDPLNDSRCKSMQSPWWQKGGTERNVNLLFSTAAPSIFCLAPSRLIFRDLWGTETRAPLFLDRPAPGTVQWSRLIS